MTRPVIAPAESVRNAGLRPGDSAGLPLQFFLLLMTTTLLCADVSAPIDALFQPFSQVNAPGVCVLVVHHGKTFFAKGYGLADLEIKTPITTNTNFRLASVSKQFTALAVLQLAERGKLRLDERLPAFFPEFPAFGRDITVKHLLTHTSGLPDYEDLIPAGTTIPVLDQDVLRLLLAQAKTYFAPGSQYRYSNTGYALLALIVEVRSGLTYARYLQDQIFRPLKMTHTLAYEAGLAQIPNRAFGHSRESNGWQRADQSLTSSVLGDGGIYSSVTDLAKWDAALYRSKLVSESTLRAAFTAHTPTDKPGRSYGFGWYLTTHRGVRQIYHSGETRGFRTRLARFPEKHFTVILLANRADATLEGLPEQIFDLVFPEKS
jgi:CubicO group peptidase (beta-lactamase class C family)